MGKRERERETMEMLSVVELHYKLTDRSMNVKDLQNKGSPLTKQTLCNSLHGLKELCTDMQIMHIYCQCVCV